MGLHHHGTRDVVDEVDPGGHRGGYPRTPAPSHQRDRPRSMVGHARSETRTMLVYSCEYVPVAFESWEEAADALAGRLAPAEPALLALAASLGVDNSKGTHRLLVVARIEDAVAAVTGHNPPPASTHRQVELLTSLGIQPTPGMTRREADATIQIAIVKERLEALRTLRPARGDRLVRIGPSSGDVGEINEVSSVDRLGHVWVKGASGHPARPQDLRRPPS